MVKWEKSKEIIAMSESEKAKPQYVRQQKGHSVILAVLFGWATLYILPVYWTISKDHYWHI
jgi:hypothetical protein